MPVPGSPEARCGPLVFGLMREPASLYIGCASSAIVGYVRALVSATTCLLGLSSVCGSGSASNASTIALGGRTYLGESEAVGTCAARPWLCRSARAGARTNEKRISARKNRVDITPPDRGL